jgi:hypothetical protein
MGGLFYFAGRRYRIYENSRNIHQQGSKHRVRYTIRPPPTMLLHLLKLCLIPKAHGQVSPLSSSTGRNRLSVMCLGR